MAKKVFKASLSVSSLKKLKSEIQKYREELPNRVAQALDILAEKGVKVAEDIAQTSGTFGQCVVFESVASEINDTEVTAIMRGIDLGVDISWQQKDNGVKTERVNALLMLEFGSGSYADDEHRGTFPTETKHGLDPNGWWFKPVGSDEWIHSYGYKPKRPMYEAYLKMEEEVVSAFNEAFR